MRNERTDEAIAVPLFVVMRSQGLARAFLMRARKQAAPFVWRVLKHARAPNLCGRALAPEAGVLLCILPRERSQHHRLAGAKNCPHRGLPRTCPPGLSKARVEEDKGVGQSMRRQVGVVEQGAARQCLVVQSAPCSLQQGQPR
eukprot:CAMPEP_0119360296 /NCGR_PEP_ID=MMETSP1334-20130426/7949_1 /TAXON_ID=127549 /ORGANISM="Calcidiscus leptoporus, Strain RCC1130" /LENGTH=142 /DNA_ID=CAMNT_0007375117 /DNA_START=214 /DNA_END=642 /DNA_ORIENTATION=+